MEKRALPVPLSALLAVVPALGTQGLSFTAGWSVGAFFIPLLNLLLPVMVVGEVWRASAPSRVDGPIRSRQRERFVQLRIAADSAAP